MNIRSNFYDVMRRMSAFRVSQKSCRRLPIIAGILLVNIVPGAYPFGSGVARASELSDLANSMQPGSFATLQTNGFNNGAVLTPSGAANYITMFADSAEWDPNSRTVNFIGASHSNPIATYLLYRESTNTWTTVSNPVPNSIHGYDHNAIDTSTGDFFHRPFFGGSIHQYSRSSQSWSQFSLPNSNYAITGGLEYFPEMNSLVYVDRNMGVWSRNLGQGNWVQRSSPIAMGEYHTFIEYNPVHNVMVFGGGQNDRTVYKMDAGGSITRMNDAPVGLGVGTNESRISVDTISGDFIVVKPNRQMYTYDVSSDQWSTLGITYPAGNPADGTIEASISDYGVIMYIHFDGGNSAIYLYKHSPGGGTPPPAPVVPESPGDLTVQ